MKMRDISEFTPKLREALPPVAGNPNFDILKQAVLPGILLFRLVL
jgi:hypothetical protein